MQQDHALQNIALVEQFLDAIWMERNLSENTLASYRHDINPLLARLARSNASLLSVSSLDLQALLAERVDQGYKASICIVRNCAPMIRPPS